MRPIAILGFIFMAAVLSLSASLQQASASDQNILQAPPAPVYEVDPGERPGFVLTPGYWRWNGTHHVWVRSRWIPARPGYTWTPDRWEQQGDEWHFSAGHWDPVQHAGEIAATEEAEEPDAATPPDKGKKPTHKRHKKIDYSDTTKWPRVIHH